MDDGPNPLELLLVTVAGWVSRRQQRVIEYLLKKDGHLQRALNDFVEHSERERKHQGIRKS